MSTLVIKRIWIESAECTGHQLCVPEASELIEYLSKDDASVVKSNQLRYTQQELVALFGAASVCPMSAFYLETEDGRTLNVDADAIQQALKSGDYRWSDAATGTPTIARSPNTSLRSSPSRSE